MSSYDNVFACRDIASYISRGNKAECYGYGWHCTRISASYAEYSDSRINVTVFVEVTENGASNSDISHRVNVFVSDRLNDFSRRHPGVLERTDPKIDIVIRKS